MTKNSILLLPIAYKSNFSPLSFSPAIFKTDKKRKDTGKSRPKSAVKLNVDKSQVFPSARGLVNK